MKNILLTGGTGYIGSHIAVELLNSNHHVTIIDSLVNSDQTVINNILKITGKTNQELKFYKNDLRDYKTIAKIMQNENIEAVIHLAALKAVGESVEKPLMYYDNNLVSSISLLEAMDLCKIKNLIFSSSATVYGSWQGQPFTEDKTNYPQITNPYGQTKAMVEQIIKDYQAANPDFNATLLRYFNPIGAHSSGLIGENPKGTPNNLLPYILEVATKKLPVFHVFGNNYDTPDGTCLRDYIHVVDLAVGHLSALNHLHGFNIYNLGTGKGTSVLEMITAFTKATGVKINYQIDSPRLGDTSTILANPKKANQELDWWPTRSIEDACLDSYNYQIKSSR